MKIRSILLLFLYILIASCTTNSQTPIAYTSYTPVLMTKLALASSVKLQTATPIGIAAKIYHKDNYIFISERFKGVHIIDNSNPSAPINKRFISIPGCVDMAIKNNVLYADNAVDLVSINLTLAQSGDLQVLKRIEDVFPELMPPDGLQIPDKFTKRNRPANTIIVNWVKQPKS
ncbi:MAG: hypothetical protein EOP00_13175 [Pedobacter sp.]|nr:MAG: hypothetical protein EOP00_13175 [Pedobacter sp.]